MLAWATASRLVDGLQFAEQIVVAAAQRGGGGRGSNIVVAFFLSSWPPRQSVGLRRGHHLLPRCPLAGRPPADFDTPSSQTRRRMVRWIEKGATFLANPIRWVLHCIASKNKMLSCLHSGSTSI